MTTSFNATKDKLGFFVEEAAGSAGDIQLVLLQAADLQADAVIADHATLAALLAANDEATFTNYTRKTLATPTRTVDNTGDRVLLGGAAPGTAVQVTWAEAGGAVNNTLGAVVFVYVPAGAADDTTVLPLMATTISASTDGNDLVLTLHDDGFARVINP